MIFKENPDIIFLNETWLKPENNFSLHSYNTVRQDRDDGYGGVSTCIRKNITFKLVSAYKTDHIQYIIVLVGDLLLINMYVNRDFAVTDSLLTNLYNHKVGSNSILMGDLNSHHPLWDKTPANRGGKVLYNFILEKDLVLMNNGAGTIVQAPGRNLSAVDLTIVSGALAVRSTWNIIYDCGNSDHYPTCIEININDNQQFQQTFSAPFKQRNFSKADWQAYHDKILIYIIKSNSEPQYEDLINIMNLAAEESIPYKNCGTWRKSGNPWWDEECSVWVSRRKQAIKNFNNHPTMDCYLLARKEIALARKHLREKKRKKFVTFCETLNRNSNTKYVWSKVKKFSNGGKSNKYQLIPNNTKFNILHKLSRVNIDPTFSPSTLSDPSDAKTFNISELENALNNKKLSAPGLDDTTYPMFKNLPFRGKQILLSSYNKILLGNRIPDSWRKHKIISFLKPNRDAAAVENYRPIALTSCGGKILETMIKNRLDWYTERNSFFNNKQWGFRKGKSIHNNIAYLTTFIFKAFLLSESAVAVFLDIKSAYDNVNIYTLYKKLENIKVPVEINNLIHQFLRTRLLYSRANDGTLLGPTLATSGLPQGSPLSTILFNIYTSDIFNLDLGNVSLIGYADDLALVTKGTCLNTMVSQITNALEILDSALKDIDLTLAPHKCEAVWFTKGRRRTTPPSILINNQLINFQPHVKYLGILLHQQLKWDKHVDQILVKARKGLNVLKALCRIWWGADPNTLLTIFHALVGSFLDFGTMFVRPTSQKNLDKIDSVFYEGLRVCLGCMKSTPKLAILSEASTIDPEHRRKILSAKHISKIICIRNHPTVSIISDCCRQLALRPPYCGINNLPYIITAYRAFFPNLNKIHQSVNLPCYELDYNCLFTPLKTLECNIKKQDLLINASFCNFKERYRHSYTFIFSDASKKDGKLGYGIFIPALDYRFSSRLPDDISVCKAEIVAIQDAAKVAIQKRLKKVIIFSDSLSAIQKINSNLHHATADYWTLRTKRLIFSSSENGFDIRLAWIPGHSGIPENDEVDTLANVGRSLNIPKQMTLDSIEVFNNIKQEILTHFKNSWRISIRNKKHKYFNVQSEYAGKKWFSKFPYKNRRHITTLIRMRTGHCLTGENLYKINIKDNPLCECGQIEDLNHIFFYCPINHIVGYDLYKIFIDRKFSTPITIYDIISSPSEENINILMRFLNHNKIEL